MAGEPSVSGVRVAVLATILFISTIMIGSVLGGDFTAQPSPSLLESESIVTVNFTLVNTDSTENITNITVGFPTELEFITGTDFVDNITGVFSNTTANISWGNTSAEGILNSGNSSYIKLSFYNMSAPGNYTFNISVWHTNGELNYTLQDIEIQDTTPPSTITLISPTNGSWTTSSAEYINLSYTELNPSNCTYYNGTANITNSTSSSPCQVYVTGYSEGTWTYRLYVNDTTGNEGQSSTYTIRYDATDPGLNSLGIFQSGGNVSASSIVSRTNVTISVNITDALSGVNTSSVAAMIYNESEDLIKTVQLSQANGDYFNGTWDTGTDNTGDGVYTIHVNGSDEAGNSPSQGMETTLTFQGAPDLTVTGIAWTSNNANPGCPHSGNSITLNITIANIGDGNFSGNFNVTTDIDSSQNKSLDTLDNTSLDEGESMTLNVTFTPGNFSNNRYYTFLVEVDAGGDINESAEDNNTYSIGFNLGYNITMHIFNETTYPAVGKAFPDSNVTLNISVTCGDGTGVTSGLSQSNFQFFNKWGAEASTNITNRVYSFSHKGGGYYATDNFNTQDLYTQSNRTRGRHGDNTLNVTVISGSYYSRGLLLYNITAPDLTVNIDIDDGDDFDLADVTEVEFNVTITNIGNAPAYNVRADEEDDWYFPEYFYIDQGDYDKSSTIYPGQTIIWDEIELGSDEEDDGDEYNLYLYIHYNDSAYPDNVYSGFDKDRVEVTDSSGTTGDDDDDDSSSPGGDSGDTLDLELTLMDWDDEINGYPGGSNTTRLEVKNTGDVTVVAKVSFTCDVVGETTIAPISKSLGVGVSQVFIVNFDIEDDADIGEYDCTAKAYVSSSEDDYDSETTVLKILATEAEAAEIESDYENKSSEVKLILDRFIAVNQNLVDENNYTRVKNIMDNLNETLNEIAAAIADSDYITANELLQSLQASMLTAENSLSDLEAEQTMGGGVVLSGTWYWVVIIIVVVIAVAFVAYLLFPQKKGYGPKKGLLDSISGSVKDGTSKMGDIKDSGKSKLGSLKEKSLTTGGYKPKGSGPGAKIKGALGKLKDKFKRKKKPQKEVTQYFVSSSNKMINYS